MAIQISFKEAAGRAGSIDTLANIARALKDSDLPQINVFFEFDNQAELLMFCKLAKAISSAQEIEGLEAGKKGLMMEIDALEKERADLRDSIEEIRQKKFKK